MNLSPCGVHVYSVCLLRNGIHLAAPSPMYPEKYCLFQAKGYPSQLWGAGAESLGLRCTRSGPVSGTVNIHLQRGLATCVVPRFWGQCCSAPPDCAPNRFTASGGGPREQLSDVHCRGAGSSAPHRVCQARVQPCRGTCLPSRLSVTFTNKFYSLPSIARLAEKWFAHICVAGWGQLDVPFVYSWMNK